MRFASVFVGATAVATALANGSRRSSAAATPSNGPSRRGTREVLPHRPALASMGAAAPVNNAAVAAKLQQVLLAGGSNGKLPEQEEAESLQAGGSIAAFRPSDEVRQI